MARAKIPFVIEMVDRSNMAAERKGGEKDALPHHSDFYWEIGHKGGEAGIKKDTKADVRK